MSAAEHMARAYCRAINADPDQSVTGFDQGFKVTMPRGRWYIGSVPGDAA